MVEDIEEGDIGVLADVADEEEPTSRGIRIPKEHVDMLFQRIFQEGMTSLITGPRGRGKTTLAMILAYWCLQNGYHVLSNIICKKCIGISETKFYKRGRFAGQPKRLFSPPKDPPNYHKVTTFAEVFGWIGKLLKEDPENQIVFIIDEGAISIGSSESVMAKNPRSFFQFLTLARKFQTSTIIIAVSAGLLQKRIRAEEFGFLGAVMSKDIHTIAEFGEWALKEQKIYKKDLFVLKWQEYQAHESDVLLFDISPLGVPLAKPEASAEIGEIVFDSKASADLGLGVYPGTTNQFNMRAMITHISNCTSEEIPDKILEFLTLGGKIQGVREEYGEEEFEEISGDIEGPHKQTKGGAAVTRRLVAIERERMVLEGTYGSRTPASIEIAEILTENGWEIKPRAVAYHLKAIDEEGYKPGL